MGVVHASRGRQRPASQTLRSEPAIVAGLARAVLGSEDTMDWEELAADYDRIRDRIRAERSVEVGVVVSDARDKTVTVEVPNQMMHPRYDKVVRTSTKFHAHDETNDAHIGDTVRIYH
mgnify:CR=1 FL=1